MRDIVFGILRDAGVTVTKNADGHAAKVLRAVLEEADRWLSRRQHFRATFNGSQWADWVGEYTHVEKAATVAAKHGMKAGIDWIRAHPLRKSPRRRT